jgi:hypothetical protein
MYFHKDYPQTLYGRSLQCIYTLTTGAANSKRYGQKVKYAHYIGIQPRETLAGESGKRLQVLSDDELLDFRTCQPRLQSLYFAFLFRQRIVCRLPSSPRTVGVAANYLASEYRNRHSSHSSQFGST